MTLEAQHLYKSFYDPEAIAILRGVTLRVAQGETVAITGPSGSGKSTLLHILGGLESADQGSVWINNTQLTKANTPHLLNTDIGFVFQSFHLLEDMTTLENILLPARIARKNTRKGSEAERRAHMLLEYVDLSDRAHFMGKHLSGGEKQRAAIARALCNNPTLILADEPTGNLDPKHATSIHELLIGIAKKENKSVIIVTHNTKFADKCDSVYGLDNGTIS